MTLPDRQPLMTRDRREQIEKLIREHVKCDATGLAPAVASVFLVGFEDAAEAIAAALPEVGEVERLKARVAELRARLEIDHVFQLVDGEMVRVEVPEGEYVPDGIECRDETIKLLTERTKVVERARDEARQLSTDAQAFGREMKRQRDTAVEERDRLQAENDVLALKLAEAKAEVERRKLERARPGIVRPFRLGAFATGSYTCKCLSCGEQFTGDKRAVSCLPCAAEAAEHARDEAVAEIERLNGALIAEQEHTDRLQSENATMAIKMAGLEQECVASMEEIAALRNDLDNALSRLERAKEALSEVRQWAKNMKGRTDCTRLQFREVCAEIEDRAASALQLMGGER